jgi:hypothetical protein
MYLRNALEKLGLVAFKLLLEILFQFPKSL